MRLDSYSMHHIFIFTRDENGNQLTLTSSYGNPNTGQKEVSWRLLRELKPNPNNEKPWICFGDFNEIPHQHEKVGAIARSYQQMANFRAAVKDCGLSDLGF